MTHMKKLVLFFLVGFFTNTVFSQTAGMTAIIDSKKSLVTTNEGKSTATFLLVGDQGAFAFAREEAAKYVNYMKSEWQEISSDKVECTLSFTHEVPVDYIRKMMTAFGVDRFIFKGNDFSIEKLSEIVKE